MTQIERRRVCVAKMAASDAIRTLPFKETVPPTAPLWSTPLPLAAVELCPCLGAETDCFHLQSDGRLALREPVVHTTGASAAEVLRTLIFVVK